MFLKKPLIAFKYILRSALEHNEIALPFQEPNSKNVFKCFCFQNCKMFDSKFKRFSSNGSCFTGDPIVIIISVPFLFLWFNRRTFYLWRPSLTGKYIHYDHVTEDDISLEKRALTIHTYSWVNLLIFPACHQTLLSLESNHKISGMRQYIIENTFATNNRNWKTMIRIEMISTEIY